MSCNKENYLEKLQRKLPTSTSHEAESSSDGQFLPEGGQMAFGRLSRANTQAMGSSISMTEQRQWRELSVTLHEVFSMGFERILWEK